MLLSKIKQTFARIKLKRMRTNWVKNGHVKMDETTLIFPETSLSAVLGSIDVGKRSCIRGALEIQRENGRIKIGNNCYIGDHTRIWSAESIIIKNNVLIAHNVNIFDNDTHPIDKFERKEDSELIIWNAIRKDFSTLKSAPIVIEDDAWIGCNSIILKGVTIGEGSIVAAGSVVTKSVPPNVLVAGNPAKIVKELS